MARQKYVEPPETDVRVKSRLDNGPRAWPDQMLDAGDLPNGGRGSRDIGDAAEAAWKSRARRQALMLIIASSLTSLLALYEGWHLLSGRG